MAGARFCAYMYNRDGDNFKLTECDDACGLKYYTMASSLRNKTVAAKTRNI